MVPQKCRKGTIFSTVFFLLKQRVAVEETCSGREVSQTIYILIPVAYPESSNPVIFAIALSDPCVEVTDDELVKGLLISDDFF
ncbi:unnamed protein product [Nippostrongylus brasiliensis]|uniref:DUF2088 domain-containing protein n=1 Tax=Nippostrongylus brasiliensis TaxID=27835 RepID=A0A0N4Y6Z0_NIPBR|nr:unnamed protein product [Nippostrongylus brasiliensis]